MDYQKALSILELKPNFTEEDLKISHRKLSKIYHPDKYTEGTDLYHKMQIKQQEINAARDYLKKYLKEHQMNNNNNNIVFDLKKYKEKKITELKKINHETETVTDREFEEISNKIKDIIFTFETEIWMPFAATQKDVDHMYNLCITSIHNILINYVKSFFQKNYIDKNEIEEKIDLNASLVEFYNQLLKIKEKYSKEVKLRKKLDEEIERYQECDGYEQLKYLLNVYKQNAFDFIKQSNFQNVEKIIENIHQQIQQEIFEVYYTLKKKISEIGTIINGITEESIKKEYFAIYSDFEARINFDSISESLKKLEKRISKYQEIELKKQKQREIEESIKQIYQALIARYSEVLKQYNIITDEKEINELNEFLNKILQLFIKGCKEFENLEFFKLFNNITFQNKALDRKIVENLIQFEQTNKQQLNSTEYDESEFNKHDNEQNNSSDRHGRR